ncbi:glutamine-dependent NAD(+) synthetase [Monascus purpureus]|uniref:Glutamine-dependent NAD(+) synthetase n=1 Tax=Monascus purpureus TaxID=5098 RepID=A0A507QUU8_MONPU|nr:glutamine-dependent NAD(+) synthetase [Monascus purpureus]BDD58745.1 glutamine-dependent NAD(+) synthetase [Monascus purpureus]
MGRLITLATCSLNQWALDFEGNTARIIESIRKAKEAGATMRVGPELEITGYGLLDHFLEGDTFLHSWEMLARIIDHPDCQDIVVTVGMPVRHRNVRYNCSVIFYNRKIVLIRPKMWLANDGNYREMRYFTPWQRLGEVEDYYLEQIVGKITGQYKVPFGDAVISTRDTCVGLETCEELFTPDGPHIPYGLGGVEIISNSSGSHHELRKLDTRVNLITQATKLGGGVYLYANQQGCDGDRLYYDGCAMIVVNGNIVAQGSQFSLNDVEVVTATVDIEEVRSYRATASRNMQASRQPPLIRLDLDVRLGRLEGDEAPNMGPSPAFQPRYHAPEEEIALGPACWLWDYLRRSRSAGFFLPLSGGIDSCATAVIVHSMCREVIKAISEGNEEVIRDARRISGESEDSTWVPSSPQELCNRIFHTSYMGTQNSSKETRDRSKKLAEQIGSYHVDFNFDSIITAVINMFSAVANFHPKFKVHGGSWAENIALQNLQARLRMVLAYLYASLLPTVRQRPGGGSLLVLGSSNVDECLRGYLTKYDCSSADLNPIGSISKVDLKKFIAWARDSFNLPILDGFLNATPTAELEPITATYVQSDEADMGVTYKELSVFGYFRKVAKLGPWSMYEKLLHLWGNEYSPREIYEKTRHFFHYYSINRHKMTVLTPSYHAEQYSPEDNRHDLRQFLYPPFTWAYKKMEENVKFWESKGFTTGKAEKNVKSE